MAVCRAVCMGVVLIMLAIALGPTGWISQYAVYSTPAKCLFSPTASTINALYAPISFAALRRPTNAVRRYNTPLTLLSLGFLILSYLTRVIRIFPTSSKHTRHWLKVIPGDEFRTTYLFVERKTESKSSQTFKIIWSILRISMKITYVLLKAVYEIHDSMLWEVGPRFRGRN